MDHYRPSRPPDRRPPKRKVSDLSPDDIGHELPAPRRTQTFFLKIEERFEYYETEWNLRLGERLLTRAQFRDLAEELDTTNILRIHTEGMRRYREADEVRRQYRMVKPTVIPTSPPIPRGPRADSSSSSPWPSQTPTPRRESTASSAGTAPPKPEPQKRDCSPAPALENRITKAPSDPVKDRSTEPPSDSPDAPSRNTTKKPPSDSPDAPPNIIIRPIEQRISPLSPALATTNANPQPNAAPPKNMAGDTPKPLKSARQAAKPTPPPVSAAAANPMPKSRLAQAAKERADRAAALHAERRQPLPEVGSQIEREMEGQPEPERRSTASLSPVTPSTDIISRASLELEEKLTDTAIAGVKLPPPRLGEGVRKTSSRIGVETEREVQTQPQLQQPPLATPPLPELGVGGTVRVEWGIGRDMEGLPQPQPQTPSPLLIASTQSQSYPRPQTPPPPTIKLEHPPSPSILIEVTARIHHRRAIFLAERRAAHAEKVTEAKRKCWEGARELVGEVACLAELVGCESCASREGDNEGGLFVPDENEDDANTNLKQKGADAAGKREAPPDLSEPLLLTTLTSLIAWEDNARSIRRRQEEVVGALEGMGMDADEARKVVGRLGGVMARVAGVRWGLEDCLVLMGGEGG